MLERIRRHAVAIYVVLTFALSWGGVAILMGPGLMPRTKDALATALPLAIGAMLVGPAVAGLLMAGLASGRAGLRDMLARALIWRVDARWYVAALLTAPLVTTGVFLVLSLAWPVFRPGVFTGEGQMSRLLFALTAGVAVGIGEEIGWTGFATPQLRCRHSIVRTGLIVGVVWGTWHIIATVMFASGAYAGALTPLMFVTARTAGLLVGSLPAYRVLIVWVYDRTGSLLLAMLMHASLTASTLSVEPVGIEGPPLLISDAVSAAVWWAVVAVVAWISGWRLSREPFHARAA